MDADSGRFEGRQVLIGGEPIFYRRSAEATEDEYRIAVVLVHGLGLSGRYMMPVAKRLAARYRVLLPDLPGFGDSAGTDNVLDVPGLADALAAWMRALRLNHAALVGNSFGCQIIADLAARHPGLVGRAVLQGPTTPPEDASWFRQFVRWRQNQPYNPKSLSPITWDDYRKCGVRRLLWTFHYQLKDRIEAKLPLIAAPVLVVRGQQDPICRHRWAAEVTSRLPEGRYVEIPGVAHTLVYTSPEELAGVIRPFLDEARPKLRPVRAGAG
jgi:2-hydroxy-6-oxonona-2,4-dienedioate hydrolase